MLFSDDSTYHFSDDFTNILVKLICSWSSSSENNENLGIKILNEYLILINKNMIINSFKIKINILNKSLKVLNFHTNSEKDVNGWIYYKRYKSMYHNSKKLDNLNNKLMINNIKTPEVDCMEQLLLPVNTKFIPLGTDIYFRNHINEVWFSKFSSDSLNMPTSKFLLILSKEVFIDVNILSLIFSYPSSSFMDLFYFVSGFGPLNLVRIKFSSFIQGIKDIKNFSFATQKNTNKSIHQDKLESNTFIVNGKNRTIKVSNICNSNRTENYLKDDIGNTYKDWLTLLSNIM